MRLLAPLLLLPLLAACTDDDWNRLMRFGDATQPAPISRATTPGPPPQGAQQGAQRAKAAAPPGTQQGAQQAPQTAQSAAAAPNPFCLGVAKNDAVDKGFDEATQGKVALRSYQQCVALFASQAAQ